MRSNVCCNLALLAVILVSLDGCTTTAADAFRPILAPLVPGVDSVAFHAAEAHLHDVSLPKFRAELARAGVTAGGVESAVAQLATGDYGGGAIHLFLLVGKLTTDAGVRAALRDVTTDLRSLVDAAHAPVVEATHEAAAPVAETQ